MNEIERDTFTTLLQGFEINNRSGFFSDRIGVITVANDDGTFGVQLLENVRIENNQSDKPFIPSCPVWQDNNATRGSNFEYNVGDVVNVRFTDIDYRHVFADKNINNIVVDYTNDRPNKHTIEYAYINKHVNLSVAPIKNGIYADGAKMGFQSGKNVIENQQTDMVSLLTNFSANLIATIKGLIYNDSLQGVCVLKNPDTLDTLKRTFDAEVNSLFKKYEQ